MYAQNYNPLNLSSMHKPMCVEGVGVTYDPLFQLDNVRDINYRTEETPTESTNINYEHSTPTYGLPGGKWVMSSVTIDDGIRDDGPMMKTMFAYSDGQKDRHEREFLGFGKVVTKNIDTEQGESAVYRQAVQLYDVSTYYAQGNELGVSVEDAKGNKYTETRNEYDGYYLGKATLI